APGHPRRHRPLLHRAPRDAGGGRCSSVSFARARSSRVAAEPQALRGMLVPPTRVYLAPGLLYASADGALVTTILGSCVAVGLFDPWVQAGGINHFLLP